MAQLISYDNSLGILGEGPDPARAMPNIPGFQWMAMRGTRGQINGTIPPGALAEPFTPLAKATLLCVANTAGVLDGTQIFVQIGNIAQLFEFMTTGSPPAGVIQILISDGDTAAQVASATAAAIVTWLNALIGNLSCIVAQDGATPALVDFLVYDPAIRNTLIVGNVTSPIPAANFGNINPTTGARQQAPFGSMLLQRAWRAFVFQGIDTQVTPIWPFVPTGTAYDDFIPTPGIIPVRGKPMWVQPLQIWPLAFEE